MTIYFIDYKLVKSVSLELSRFEYREAFPKIGGENCPREVYRLAATERKVLESAPCLTYSDIGI
jgi:hypothetical protein